MKYVPVLLSLPADELPENFSYPPRFLEFICRDPMDEIPPPWGITASTEANSLWSEQFHQPLVQFAQAWHEDMVACFCIAKDHEPSVVVLDPWAKSCVNGIWSETGEVIAELPDFAAWLEWTRNCDLVDQHTELRECGDP